MGISNKMEFEVFFMWTLNKRRKIVCGYLSSYPNFRNTII